MESAINYFCAKSLLHHPSLSAWWQLLSSPLLTPNPFIPIRSDQSPRFSPVWNEPRISARAAAAAVTVKAFAFVCEANRTNDCSAKPFEAAAAAAAANRVTESERLALYYASCIDGERILHIKPKTVIERSHWRRSPQWKGKRAQSTAEGTR